MGLRVKIAASTICIALCAISTPALGSQLAGSSCKKAGLIKKSGEYQYVCAKSGKKFVWKKTAFVKLPATPKPSITPAPKEEIKDELNGLSSAISKSAFESLTKFLKDQPELTAGKVILELSPNASQSLANWTLLDMQKGFRFWQKYTPPSMGIHMVFADRADMAWFTKTMNTVRADNSDWLPRIVNLANSDVNMALAGANGQDSNGNGFFFFLPGKNTSPNSAGWLGTGPHEWTHLAQMTMTQNRDVYPCWFKEGQATYFGNAISNNDLSQWSKIWKSQLSSLDTDYSSFFSMDKKALEKWFDSHTFNMPQNVCGPDGAFMIGAMAVEYMVGTIGVEGVNNILLQLGKGKNWDDAIAVESGMKVDALMQNIVEFVLLQRAWLQK